MKKQVTPHTIAGNAPDHEATLLRIERDISRLILRRVSQTALIEDLCALLVQEATCRCAAIVLWSRDRVIGPASHAGDREILDDLLRAAAIADLPVYARSVFDDPSGLARHPLNSRAGVILSVLLQHDGQVFGILSVGVADDAAISFLEPQWWRSVGTEIALGLDRIDQYRGAAAERPPRMNAGDLDGVEDTISGMVYQCRNDPSWQMTRLQGSVISLTGYHAEQLIANREIAYGDLIDPDYRDRVWEQVQKAVHSGQYFKVTYPIHTATGERRWVWERGFGVVDASGNPVALKGFITDITELKNVENALRESEARYRLLADNTLDMIWQMDMDLRFTYVNPAVEDILGHRPEEMIGTHLADLCSPSILEAVRSTLKCGLEEEVQDARRTLTARLRHKNGHEVPLEVRARFIFGEAPGPPVGIQGTSRDMTHRLAAEKALRDAEAAARKQKERLQTIVDNIPLMVTFLKPEDRHLWVNRAWENHLGWRSSEVAERDLMAAFYPDPEYRRYVLDFIRRAEGVWQDIEMRIADGRKRLTVWKHVRLTDGSIIGIGEDVTEARQALKRQQELEQQLFQSQRMEAVGRLAGGVAHDFNNLLAVILGYADLVLESMAPHHAHYEPLKDIYDTAIRARDLTRHLLAFGRRQMLSFKVLDVNAVIRGFDKLMRRLIGEDIALDLQQLPQPLPVKADIAQLEQVLMNLAVNARDAMPHGGRLTIATSRVALEMEGAEIMPGHYALIAVSDSGSGMDRATLQRIFEPFYTTKGKDVGTGLGLSTVYGIVKQHGGNIRAYSQPGKGSTFKVYLPLASAEKLAEAQPPAPQAVAVHDSATVLIAEDDPNVRRLTAQILGRKGYHVLAANTVDDAVRIGRSHAGPIDLLLSDVIMPGMTGPQLHAKLSPDRPEMKVIFMSGYSGEAISRHGVLDHGTYFVQKPFSARTLLAKVAEAMTA